MGIYYRKEEGFTLVEILAAIVILSVAALAMIGFFINAMNSAKGNENKTIMVNLARNALAYIGKQDFTQLDAYFRNGSRTASGNPPISTDACSKAESGVISCDSRSLADLLGGMENSWDVLSPVVNGQTYRIVIQYNPSTSSSGDTDKFLIPVKVTAKGTNSANNAYGQAVVEGYVTHEKIR